LTTKKVIGILVGSGDAPIHWTPVAKSPNNKWGLNPSVNYSWNPFGDDFANQYFNIPIFALDFSQPDAQGPSVEKVSV
jgi:hypothetical protein